MTLVTTTPTLFGRIVTVNPDGFGFIGIKTVTKERGEPHGLETTQDIFINREDAGMELKVGSEVGFDVIPDRKRGGDALRAQGVVAVIESEILPAVGSPMPGFSVMAPKGSVALASRGILPAANGFSKEIPEEDLAKVELNQPMAGIPREEREVSPQDAGSFLGGILEQRFARLRSMKASCRIKAPEEELDAELEQTTQDLREMKMDAAADDVREQVKSYKDIKLAFENLYDEGIVRPNTIIPIHFLPDFFMAAPVWYFWADEESRKDAEIKWNDADPRPHPKVTAIVDLIAGLRWADTFQMFNRRMRTLDRYQGDIIPAHIARRMVWARLLFDHVVIATPYHDVAGKDWEDLEWLRSIDPYIIGFKNGVPFFFILGRFSDSGTFPLFNEMLADTMNFLRLNISKLAGFNLAPRPYWHRS